MRAYVIRRLLLVIPTLFMASLLVFFMIRLIPGDIIDVFATQMSHHSQVTLDEVRKALGLDVPIFIQYLRWVGNIVMHGDLGVSLWRQTSVTEMILARVPVTVELSFLGMIVSQLIALPVGIYSALRQDTWGDYISRSFAIMCIAIPGFWLATMVIVFPAIWWGYMPPIILIPFLEDPIGNLRMFIVPALVLGMLSSGITMRMTRTMMLEVLRQDYIRTAWAKGLRERVVILRHALKNALIPVVTFVGIQVPELMGGSVIIEKIFCLPGIGRLLLEATAYRDYTIVSGVMVFYAAIMVFSNLIVDLSYSFLDPRVRYR